MITELEILVAVYGLGFIISAVVLYYAYGIISYSRLPSPEQSFDD